MEISFFRRVGIDFQQDRVQRSGDGDLAGGEDVSIESLSVFLRQIQRFYPGHVDAQVEGHVLEVVPNDLAAEPALFAIAVAEMDVVECQALRRQGDRTVCDVCHIREVHP